MTYGVYRSARNASWACLLDCGIHTLPIRPILIAQKYGINCKKGDSSILHGESGEIIKVGEAIFIIIEKTDIVPRQRYTIMHELGHYLLGHLGDEPLARSERDCRPAEEQAADKFAIDMLAPACVLWGLRLRTPNEIAEMCQISMKAAQFRAKRMELLYQREKFLSHPLERQVYAQFEDFIRNNRK